MTETGLGAFSSLIGTAAAVAMTTDSSSTTTGTATATTKNCNTSTTSATTASSSVAAQQFCVRWNSHLGSLGAAFPQLLAGQRFVDVTLACEGHQVHCHRLVLAACSTYFESLLGENPCRHPIIILPRDIRLWAIQALVDFMYKGEVNVSQAGLPDLLRCAEQLQIRGLCGSEAALNLNQITNTGSTSATTSAGTATTTSAAITSSSSATMQSVTTTAAASSTAVAAPAGSINNYNSSYNSMNKNNNINNNGRNHGDVPPLLTNILRTELTLAAATKLSTITQITPNKDAAAQQQSINDECADGAEEEMSSANGSCSTELNIKSEEIGMSFLIN